MKAHLVDQLNEKWRGKTPEEILEYFLREYKGKIILASSMGAEDQVLTRMVSLIDRDTRIFTLDTGRLYQETYDLIQHTIEEYGLNIEIYFPDAGLVQEMVASKGINLFYKSIENRRLCCDVRKNKSLERALSGMEMWICGLRKDQTVTRFFNKLVEWDEKHKLLKLNPLIDWTEKQVWQYIRENDVPCNVLHDRGFPSIGCKPCTRAIQPGEDSRAGRWWWEKEEHKECGLHNSE
jgi:phosphoadenosine phosphosulfate reductase